MRTFFATFGPAHAHSDRFVEIVAEDHHAAQFYMISTYRDQWTQSLTQRLRGNRHLRKLATVYQKPNCRDLTFTAKGRK